MNCTITSPQKTTIYKDLRSITLPAFSGQAQILPGHAESFILLRKGNISLQKLNRQNETIEVMNGECYIKDDRVAVIL